MRKEQLKQAVEIQKEVKRLERDLQVWERKDGHKNMLEVFQDLALPLQEDVFQDLKQQSILAIKKRITELSTMFTEI